MWAPAKQGSRDLPRYAGLMLFAAAALIAASSSAAPLAKKAKSHTVVIEGMQFSPQQVEVKLGDTVLWTNKDFFPHTATAQDRSFDSGEIPAHRSWKFKPRKKGVFPYVCTLHPTMKGSLVVK